MEDEQNQLMDVDHVFYHEFTKIINSMQEAHNVLPEFAADEGYYRRNLYDGGSATHAGSRNGSAQPRIPRCSPIPRFASPVISETRNGLLWSIFIYQIRIMIEKRCSNRG